MNKITSFDDFGKYSDVFAIANTDPSRKSIDALKPTSLFNPTGSRV
jgi:hypothetical protein